MSPEQIEALAAQLGVRPVRRRSGDKERIEFSLPPPLSATVGALLSATGGPLSWGHRFRADGSDVLWIDVEPDQAM